MLVMTLISLYTVRVTLQVLGAEDYGIYNAVAGIIGFIGFISATLTNSAQRFLAFDLGKKDFVSYGHTFSLLMIVFITIAIVIVIIAEAIGPWVIGNYIVLPSERLTAAQCVFQLSLITLVVRFITIPYTASIVAYEKMGFYAYLSIAEAILKLIIVFALLNSPFDKLIFYASLHFLMDVIVCAVYVCVCMNKLSNCRFRWYWNKNRFKEIGSYIGWNTFGSLSGIIETQGITIVTSMFFNPIVLACRAVADRVNSLAYSFVTNFVLASSPQLVKYYSLGDDKNFNNLFYRTSMISYYLMLIITVPLVLLMPELLGLWLKDELLEEMIVFSRLSIITALVSSLETPISRAVSATGKVRLYEITNCVVALSGIPITYMLFRFGAQAFMGYVVYIIILSLSIIYRIAILKKNSTISIKQYFSYCITRAIILAIVMMIFGYCISLVHFNNVFVKIFVVGFASLIVSALSLYLSMKNNERKVVIEFITNKIKHK